MKNAGKIMGIGNVLLLFCDFLFYFYLPDWFFISLSITFLHSAGICWMGWRMDRMQQYAFQDTVTGAFNRRYMTREFRKLRMAARKKNVEFSIAMIDCDHFKCINDDFGHETGDQILRKVAHILIKAVRKNGVTARWGGDEFLLVVQTDRKEMRALCDTFQKRVGLLSKRMKPDISITFGIASFPLDGEKMEDLIRVADQRMYEEKWMIHQSSEKVLTCDSLLDSVHNIKESEAKYKGLLESFVDTVIIHRDGEILYVNESGLKLFGAACKQQIIGKSFIDFIHPDYHEVTRKRMQQLKQGHRIQPFEKTLIDLKGKIKAIETTAAPITLHGVQMVQKIIRDVSERKEIERVRKEMEELQNKNRHLDAIRQMSADVAHEIRNPLTSVKGFFELYGHLFHAEHASVIFDDIQAIERYITCLIEKSSSEQTPMNLN